MNKIHYFYVGLKKFHALTKDFNTENYTDYAARLSKVGLKGRQPSTQKLGLSSILFHRDSSFPVESIQSTGLLKCLPVNILL